MILSSYFDVVIIQLRCRSCGFSSDTIEPIFDLGLAVDNVSTVERALDSYIMVENMDGMFKCSGCHQEVYMEKQLLIYKAPEIAVLHLKRFKKDGSTYGKIQNHVYFTPKLDLKPYTSAKGREDVSLEFVLVLLTVFQVFCGYFNCVPIMVLHCGSAGVTPNIYTPAK